MSVLFGTGAAPPISLSQLPPYCGYTVRMSTSDLEVTVPYDACYITLEVLEEPSLQPDNNVLKVSLSFPFWFFSSEWQLCAATVVVGQPSETVLSCAAAILGSPSLPLSPLCLLLPLRHGSSNPWAGTGYSQAGSHRYLCSRRNVAMIFILNKLVVCLLRCFPIWLEPHLNLTAAACIVC